MGERYRPVLKAHGGDHAVAIEWVMHALAIPLQATGTIPIERARQLGWNNALDSHERNVRQFLLDIDEGTGPVVAGIGASGSDGHELAALGLTILS